MSEVDPDVRRASVQAATAIVWVLVGCIAVLGFSIVFGVGRWIIGACG